MRGAPGAVVAQQQGEADGRGAGDGHRGVAAARLQLQQPQQRLQRRVRRRSRLPVLLRGTRPSHVLSIAVMPNDVPGRS